MNDLRIVVKFEEGGDGLIQGQPYPVLAIQGHEVLLVDDHGHLAWVDSRLPLVVSVDRDGERLFDLETHRLRRRLEGLAGKRVVFTTWEHIGFDPDEVTDENMYVYRGRVEGYDGQTLFLRRSDAEESRFGILPAIIASLAEE